MDIIGLVVNLVSGIVGGNLTGAAMKEKSLSWIGSTIAGAIGGVAGGYIMKAVDVLNTLGAGNVTVGNVIGTVASAGIGGAILTGIVTFIKNKMGQSSS